MSFNAFKRLYIGLWVWQCDGTTEGLDNERLQLFSYSKASYFEAGLQRCGVG